ncbi:MAG: phage-shock protein [Desulfobacula sp.]|jgi:phage shock protein B|uniref:phage-shock protein n=1 Tax=Desulfobacula sp. TaxID=2593537 RepID=UPI001DA21D06|nr:phage-shock protein [Desulfobacula sp.]MBT3485796.1 phage-shock protein [Desulfobacula sp.]MBT3803420.1 phage-shock protein [Desulfobacula sp.]MBT4024341.1 phage-shock protein [Desulfobacula sp.]MBT4199652.1 phage-shock protein [Desulfobacula sp.]
MTGALIVGICIGGAILLIATLGLIIIGIIRASKTGGLSKKEKQNHAEETKMIQDIYHGLSKMEERVDALETILIERQRKDFNK